MTPSPAPLPTAIQPRATIAAMILAAGRGERMRPLTDTTPKPLLRVRGKPLMQWHLEALGRGGFRRAVVNTAWLGNLISDEFGSVFALQPSINKGELLLNTEQLEIRYSHEGHDFGGALETAGGVVRALPLLCRPAPSDAAEPTKAADVASGADVFWVLAGDVFAPDFAFRQADVARFIQSGQLAHLWLVPNPAHHPGGDFGLIDGLALNETNAGDVTYTYSTIGLYRRALFEPPWCDIPAGNPQGLKAPLGPLLRAAMDNGRVSAELYHGAWTDVGTPERLQALNQARAPD